MRNNKIDWIITIVPLTFICMLCVLFLIFPSQSNDILLKLRYIFGDKFSVFYLTLGISVFAISLYLAFSKYGSVVLGKKNEKPKYSFFTWGSMMFTCGLAADILFYSFSEWILYSNESHINNLGTIQQWGVSYSIFHWSFIPWAFYLVLAVAFAFMLHVRKRNKQKYSEACRPILNKHTDKLPGRIIDLLAVFALIAGTATTFSIATPLISAILVKLFNITISRTIITVIILLVTCIVYTYSLLHGIKGISVLAKTCIYMFFGFLISVLIFSGKAQFIVESGFESIGRVIQNFVSMSTYVDPLRENSFPQNWTTYFWAYWMVWCVAAPFFIGSISRGRTVKQTILGGYIFGVGSTIVSFIILSNYSINLQLSGTLDLVSMYSTTGDLYVTIIEMINALPFHNIFLIILLVTMIAFYATSFDSIAYTAACYSYKNLGENEKPNRIIELMWCILLIIFPISLTFAESSMENLQSVSIIAAFPIGIVIILIIVSFFKDVKSYLDDK